MLLFCDVFSLFTAFRGVFSLFFFVEKTHPMPSGLLNRGPFGEPSRVLPAFHLHSELLGESPGLLRESRHRGVSPHACVSCCLPVRRRRRRRRPGRRWSPSSGPQEPSLRSWNKRSNRPQWPRKASHSVNGLGPESIEAAGVGAGRSSFGWRRSGTLKQLRSRFLQMIWERRVAS
jgi:hypothetical protein